MNKPKLKRTSREGSNTSTHMIKNKTLLKLKQYNDTVHQKQNSGSIVREEPLKRHLLIRFVTGLLSLAAFSCFIAGACFHPYLHGQYKKVLIIAAGCFVARCALEAILTAHEKKKRL